MNLETKDVPARKIRSGDSIYLPAGTVLYDGSARAPMHDVLEGAVTTAKRVQDLSTEVRIWPACRPGAYLRIKPGQPEFNGATVQVPDGPYDHKIVITSKPDARGRVNMRLEWKRKDGTPRGQCFYVNPDERPEWDDVPRVVELPGGREQVLEGCDELDEIFGND